MIFDNFQVLYHENDLPPPPLSKKKKSTMRAIHVVDSNFN